MGELIEEIKRAIIDNIYFGNTKLTDLIKSERLMSVGFCKECDHHMPPLLGKVNGEVKELTPIRCPRMASGFTQPNGWCYQFRKDGADLFLDTCGRVEMPIEPPKEEK